MILKTIQHASIGGAIRSARLPADAALSLMGRGRLATSARLAVDRAEAGVRSATGTVLRDEALIHDAQRRRDAADEREHAFRLRAKADTLTVESEEEVREAERRAERQRKRAGERAEQRKRRVQKQAHQTKKGAAEVTRKRAKAAKQNAARGDRTPRSRRRKTASRRSRRRPRHSRRRRSRSPPPTRRSG